MPQPDSTLQSVCFKFMPTPSGRLHIGHAWLLFVMQAIGEALRRDGREVEIVLVLDEINSGYARKDTERIRQIGEDIVSDMQQLGIPPDLVLSNGESRFFEAMQDPQIEAIILEKWRPKCGNPVNYFLHNAILDTRLGITHIVRGDEQRMYREVYEECYRKLGVDIPVLCYIPYVRQPNGQKIGSPPGAYVVQNVLATMSVEELFCLLVGQCIREEWELGSPPDRAAALRRLLGDGQWGNMVDLKDKGKRDCFFGRFAECPQIGIDGQRCVAIE